MPEKLLVFLFLLLVAYWIRSGLRYEIFATPRQSEDFMRTCVTSTSNGDVVKSCDAEGQTNGLP